MGRKRILHLIDTGGPGGAETIFAALVGGLDDERWESIAAVPVRDWLYERLRSGGVDPIVASSDGSFDVRYLLRLSGLIRQHRIDLIQAHLLTSGVYGSLAGRLHGIPVVCAFHGQADVAPNEPYRRTKFRVLDRRANRIVFVSDALRRAFLSRHRLAPSRTHVIPNGIDTRLFRPGRDTSVRGELGFNEDTILVGAVGNVRASKAYPVLLRTAAVLRRWSAAYRIVIVGETGGTLFDELLAMRAALDLEDTVLFTGFRDDVHRILRGLDIYVISSSAEGFSLSTVQAMASGVPVVATRCGGPEEIVEDGVNGVLVDTDSPEMLAAAIHGLVRDPGRRQRFARAGRRTIEQKFTFNAMIRGYEALYDRCVAMRGGPSDGRRGATTLGVSMGPTG